MPTVKPRSRPKPAVCHPEKGNFGRGLCAGCYWRHSQDGTLATFPVLRRGPVPGQPARRKEYIASTANHRVYVIGALRERPTDGPHAPACRCAIPAPRTDGPLLVCGLCSREVR